MMDVRAERCLRLALKRREKLADLSDEAFHELELAVRENPDAFVDDDEERAFALLEQALSRYADARADDDLLDDDEYAEARAKALGRLREACEQACAVSPACVDARVCGLLAQDLDGDALLDALLALEGELDDERGPLATPATGDAWTDVFNRPRLRLRAHVARTCVDGARYRMAADECRGLLTASPLDAVGARYTYALCMARLEDEEGLDWLDARFSRHGNAWLHLARTILLYKVGRAPAARRALRGYDRLCPGGAYALLQPTLMDVYVPDRPAFVPGSFDEAVLAVHEADPVIADVPDFAAWAAAQPGFLASAKDYARRNGLDWLDPEGAR